MKSSLVRRSSFHFSSSSFSFEQDAGTCFKNQAGCVPGISLILDPLPQNEARYNPMMAMTTTEQAAGTA